MEKLGVPSSLFQVRDHMTAKYNTTEVFQNLIRFLNIILMSLLS